MTTAVRSAPAEAPAKAGLFRTGWILSGRADAVWFLAFPFAAVLAALGAQAWLPFAAVAAINLWITVPHHYATWVRSYGMPEEWRRFKDRLIVGPIAIVAFTVVGLKLAPITLTLLVTAWDHQHSIMQQHGFGRIYDFKARTGMPRTGRFDLTLNWLLYMAMVVNAPMFQTLWIRELYQMNVRIPVGFVQALGVASWVILGTFLIFYAWHLVQTVRAGKQINPIKYAFIFASYFLWYYVAFNTNSILMYAVAHRLMHGVQYIVMVWAFLDRKAKSGTAEPGVWSRLSGAGGLKWFLGVALAYAVFYQFLLQVPLDTFGFGVVNFAHYEAIPQFNIPALSHGAAYELFALTMINAYGMWHYFVDSFIWKVRDTRVQAGL